MTQPTIEQLREIIEKATKGPWTAGREHVMADDGITLTVCETFLRKRTDDAQFIAASRQALPAAIDLIEEMKTALETTQAVFEMFTTYQSGDAGPVQLASATNAVIEANDLALQKWQSFIKGEY